MTDIPNVGEDVIAIPGPAAQPAITEEDLRRFVDDSFPEVYRYAARLTGADRALAEDLVQDAYVQLIRRVRSGELPAVTTGWVVITVRNRFIDHVRHERTVTRVLPFLRLSPDVEGEAMTEEGRLDRLRPIERATLVLHHVDGYPVREVASMIGKSVRATESILVRARDSARRLLTEDCDD